MTDANNRDLEATQLTDADNDDEMPNFQDATWVPQQLASLSRYISAGSSSHSTSGPFVDEVINRCEVELRNWTTYSSQVDHSRSAHRQAGMSSDSLSLDAPNRFRSIPARKMALCVFYGTLKTRLGSMMAQYNPDLVLPNEISPPQLPMSAGAKTLYDKKTLNYWIFQSRSKFLQSSLVDIDETLLRGNMSLPSTSSSSSSPLSTLLEQANRFAAGAENMTIVGNILLAAWALRNICHEGPEFLVSQHSLTSWLSLFLCSGKYADIVG